MTTLRWVPLLMIGFVLAALARPALAQTPAVRAIQDRPVETPFSVRAELVNTLDVQRALVREYPAELRDRQIGGTVVLDVLIDESGNVVRTLVAEPTDQRPTTGSSGLPALDQAALNVARNMRFTPAKNDDVVVPVWVQFPISFRVG